MVEVLIDIDTTGKTTLKVQGCAGPSCAALTADIEKALGTVTGDQKTAEYHQSAKQAQQAKAGGK